MTKIRDISTLPDLFKTGIVLLLLLMVQGCIRFDHSLIDQPREPRQTLEQQTCCDSLLGLAVHPLPVNEYVSMQINEKDAVLEFRSGKSFAKMVELPAIGGSYLLQIDSVVNIPRIDLFPEALYPMVTLLDANLNPLAVYDEEKIKFLRPIFGPRLLRIILEIEAGSSARYALVYTSPERTRQGMSSYAPYEIVNKDAFESLIYSRPTQSKHKIHFAETGMVTMLVYPNP